MKDFCIFAVANEPYLSRALPLAVSALENVPNADFHLCGINCDHLAQEFVRVNNKFPNFSFSLVNVDLDFKTSLKSSCKVRYTEGGAFCANYRQEVCLDLMNSYKCLLSMDADSIIRKDVYDIFRDNSDFDISFNYRGGRLEMSTLSSQIFVRSNEATKEYFNYYDEAIKEYGETVWFADQVGLSYAHKRFTGRVKFMQTPESYRDTRFSQDSYVWTAKGPARKGNNIFSTEVKKYIINYR